MRPLIVLALLSLPLSGCLEGDPAGPDGSSVHEREHVVPTPTGDKDLDALTPDDQVEAPDWDVGDHFGVHVWTATEDADGRHYDVVVVEETDGHWYLAASDRDAARDEAVFDLPVLGEVRRSDLATTAYHDPLPLFDFPLSDNKTWRADVRVRDLRTWTADAYEVTFTARFDPAIPYLDGRTPGFRIEGHLANGTILLAHDYLPALGWYSTLTVHEPTTADAEDFRFRAVSMGHGGGWSGTYHVHKAELLVEHMQWFIPFAPTESRLDGPATTFTVDPATDTLFAMGFSVAWQGLHETLLIDPDGTRYEWTTVHADDPFAGTAGVAQGTVDTTAVPGTWSVAIAGAGVVFVGGVVAWALTETTGDLPPPDFTV